MDDPDKLNPASAEPATTAPGKVPRPPAAPTEFTTTGEVTSDGKFVFGRTELTDISVLPQRTRHRPHILQVVSGEFAPRTIYLNDAPVVVGRGSECEVRIGSGELSRRHARLERTRRGIKLTDLESRNGVYVNEVRVQSAILRDGDTVQVGNVQMIYNEGS